MPTPRIGRPARSPGRGSRLDVARPGEVGETELGREQAGLQEKDGVAGPAWKRSGPAKEMMRRPGWAASWVLGWFGSSVFSFSFLFLNKSNLIEFKPNLNSNPMHSTKQIKLMHQHECTNKFKPKINFNYLRNKILD